MSILCAVRCTEKDGIIKKSKTFDIDFTKYNEATILNDYIETEENNDDADFETSKYN